MPSHSQCSRNRSDHPSLRRRRLVAALCLTTGIALSACGPAHKGQLTVEPVNASAEASASSSATPSKKPARPPRSRRPHLRRQRRRGRPRTSRSPTRTRRSGHTTTSASRRTRPAPTGLSTATRSTPTPPASVSSPARPRRGTTTSGEPEMIFSLKQPSSVSSQSSPAIRQHKDRPRWRPSATTAEPSQAMRRRSQ